MRKIQALLDRAFRGLFMKLKKGVRLTGLQPVMVLAATIADKIYLFYGEELVITSAVDGIHSKTSRHFLGFALDFRTRYFTHEKILQVAQDLRDALGDDFYVRVESDHIHVSFKPLTLTG